jgi:glycosyltransferase involved in cell wall biosynthesis
MRRHLLVLCHDVVDDHFDRRISQQADVWAQKGWDVTILGMTDEDQLAIERWKSGVLCVKINQRNLLPVEDLLWKAIMAVPPEQLAGLSPEAVASLASGAVADATGRRRSWLMGTARAVWKSLPVSWRERVWHLRARFAKAAFRWRMLRSVAPSMSEILPLDSYPLPFTESIYVMARKLRPDAILACDLTTIPAAFRLSADTGALVLYDSHEFYPEQITFTDRQRALLRVWDAKAFREAFYAYTISSAMADLIYEQYRPSQKPGWLTNAPAFFCQPSGRRLLRQALLLDRSIHIVLYYGRFSQFRNLDNLIFGFARANLADTRLIMMGYGDRQWIADLIAQAKAGAVVHLLDAVPASEVEHWVADADFVVIPYPAVDLNTKFCSPNKLHDCIALGVPVLANQELKDVCAVLSTYGIGVPLDLSSPDAAARSFSDIHGFQRSLGDFDSAEKNLGWPSQFESVLLCIATVEKEIGRRDQL